MVSGVLCYDSPCSGESHTAQRRNMPSSVFQKEKGARLSCLLHFCVQTSKSFLPAVNSSYDLSTEMAGSVQSTEKPPASCLEAPVSWQRLEIERYSLITTDRSHGFFFEFLKCPVPENCHIANSTHTFWPFTFSLQFQGKQASLRPCRWELYWMHHFWATRVSLEQTSVSAQFTQMATRFVFYESVHGFLYALGDTVTLIQFREAGGLHRLPKEDKVSRGESPAL